MLKSKSESYAGAALSDRDMQKYYQDRANRMLHCLPYARQILSCADIFLSEITDLRKNGYHILKNFFPKTKIESLGNQLDSLISQKKNLSSIRNHSAESDAHIKAGNYLYYDKEDVLQPSFVVREKTSSVGIVDPLINFPGLLELVLDSRLLDMATAYFETIPLLTFIKLKKSFLNSLSVADTEYFHVDGGSYKIFKALIYLNDVKPGGGPFCFIAGSHREKFKGWQDQVRYSEEDMTSVYGKDRLVQCYANAGDVILAETTGFHCGEKTKLYERGIVIVNFCVHSEYGYDYPKIKLQKRSLDTLGSLEKLVLEDVTLQD